MTKTTAPPRSLHPLLAVALMAAVLMPAAGLAQLRPDELAVLDATHFPVPDPLAANVDFWTTVYTEHDSHHVLLHDERLFIVYEVLDFTDLDAALPNEVRRRLERRKQVRAAEAKYRDILKNLASGTVSSTWPDDQARVEELFAAFPGGRSKYSGTIARMRTQTCLKDRYAEGLERSGLYMAKIEDVFRDKGMPVELSRLPFVESLFQWNAHSSAAAAGIWQFVRSTARFYLEMELEYDERYDPLAATVAAAEHLEDNHEALKSWPLAITAYNHGANGMKRAVRLLGTTDLGEIAERYRSRTFGFASRNFYAEFIAAATVYENRAYYFPGVEPLPALEFDVYTPPAFVSVRELTTKAGASLDELRDLNPALVSQVWADSLYLPKDYSLRVPSGHGPAFERAFGELDEELKSAHQVGLYYNVRRGDTLGTIASRFGTTVSELRRVNRLSNPNRIGIGQKLLIPPGRGSRGLASAPAAIAGTRPSSHVVQKGETLSSIARLYGVSIASLQAVNTLADADAIAVGQRLEVPGAERRTHVVRTGETLFSIARLYGTSVAAIRAANRLAGDLIRPAQVLVVP